jgi:hypothetical protein
VLVLFNRFAPERVPQSSGRTVPVELDRQRPPCRCWRALRRSRYSCRTRIAAQRALGTIAKRHRHRRAAPDAAEHQMRFGIRRFEVTHRGGGHERHVEAMRQVHDERLDDRARRPWRWI